MEGKQEGSKERTKQASKRVRAAPLVEEVEPGDAVRLEARVGGSVALVQRERREGELQLRGAEEPPRAHVVPHLQLQQPLQQEKRVVIQGLTSCRRGLTSGPFPMCPKCQMYPFAHFPLALCAKLSVLDHGSDNWVPHVWNFCPA